MNRTSYVINGCAKVLSASSRISTRNSNISKIGRINTSHHKSMTLVFSNSDCNNNKRSFTNNTIGIQRPSDDVISSLVNTPIISQRGTLVSHKIRSLTDYSSPSTGTRRYSTQPPSQQQQQQQPQQQQQQQQQQPTQEQPDQNEDDNDKVPPNLTLPQKFKFMVKRYGILFIIVHFTIYGITIGSFYLALSHGVDVTPIFEYFGMEKSDTSKGVGVFAVAFALTKLTGLVRTPFTFLVVPFLARYLRKIGWMKK
ncbi:hypothetical protein SAMD00019534_000290 [Acytostelium subglobosum LB1]|uniref:hypothetical protein n=1 Tax=Acytostelium subglobosum LB1 TaxID=1410327 RepID=UPI0006450642|nr:hypothetical protein SAMD00019534_000290 [Acytostelium subglobosum LB1]GAM16854.1 hypothetical protein SAMD00019534_000290 [Acytostelium subglobosum LB1]|eukprot:XP_012758916.1 hypothetical protein SAMD00019534_000290 [Acytostelium subglobosum LB1]